MNKQTETIAENNIMLSIACEEQLELYSIESYIANEYIDTVFVKINDSVTVKLGDLEDSNGNKITENEACKKLHCDEKMLNKALSWIEDDAIECKMIDDRKKELAEKEEEDVEPENWRNDYRRY